MRASEWIAVVYFLCLAVTAAVRPVTWTARVHVWLSSAILIVVAASSRLLPTVVQSIRDVIPIAYLLAGYWLPARIAGATIRHAKQARGPDAGGLADVRFEAWLAGTDAWLERVAHLDRSIARVPRFVLEALELAYFLSYVLVPLGLIAVLWGGQADATDRYWSVALLAHLSAFGALPWLDARPPWALGASAVDGRRVLMRRINLLVVRDGSNQRNTFPSGHAAGAVAIAAFMITIVPAAGPAFAVLAAGICIGAYTGRYHYAVDVVTGACTGWLSWELVGMMFRSW